MKSGAKLNLTGLEVPNFPLPGKDDKAKAIEFLDELEKIAGFFSENFEVPRVEDRKVQKQNKKRLESVKLSAKDLQNECKKVQERFERPTGSESESSMV